MKISYKWLKEFLPGLKATPGKIAERLTMVGIEVESVRSLGKGFDNIVVGHVLEKNKHPNADRLSLCKVSDGKEVYQVVCGAPHVMADKKYPFAKIGAVVPAGLEMKKAVIRGVESRGMLCSAKELQLSEESQGVLELPDDAPVGKSFAPYYGLDDTILEIAVTPNRGDCLSHVGIAREVGAIHELPLRNKSPSLPKGAFSLKKLLKIQLKNFQECPRYCSRMIREIKIAPSPLWMVHRLSHLGIRSINNVVDATNYVMLETGHPLHAFDYRFIRGGKIIIRKAGSDPKFKTLDGMERELLPDDLVIADSEGPIALAGIMGGEHAGIKDDTTDLVLEAASFDPVRIRKTAHRLGLHTESSHRFERFVPPQSVPDALDRLTALILEAAGGEISRETIDLYPRPLRQAAITLRVKRLQAILGTTIPAREVTHILRSLNLNPKPGAAGWKLVLPYYRSDLTRETDIIEEIARFTGFDRIPSALPHGLLRAVEESLESLHEAEVKQFLVSRGFDETIHLSFCDSSQIEKTGSRPVDCIDLQNPLSLDQAFLRPSLLPGLLTAYERNRQQSGVRFFELRTVFKAPGHEHQCLAGLYGGDLFSKNWQGIQKKMDFYDGKNLLEALFCLARTSVQFKNSCDRTEFHPSQSVILVSDDQVIGCLGRLHPSLLGRHDITELLYYFEIDYSRFATHWGANIPQFKSLSPFPTVERDLALLCDGNLTHEKIVHEIEENRVPWLKRIVLFDVYQGEKIPGGKKSLAFSLIYENPERTLTDEEVNRAHFDLVNKLKKDLNIELR